MSIYTVRWFPASLHLAHIQTYFLDNFIFFPTRECLNYATLHSEEKIFFFSQWKSTACLNPAPVTGVVDTGLKFATRRCSWQLISGLRLKGSRSGKVPTSTAATEGWTKVVLSLAIHMVSCLSHNLHNWTLAGAGYITYITGSWKSDC